MRFNTMLRDETPLGFHDAWAALPAHVRLMLDHLLREHEKAMVLPPAHRSVSKHRSAMNRGDGLSVTA